MQSAANNVGISALCNSGSGIRLYYGLLLGSSRTCMALGLDLSTSDLLEVRVIRGRRRFLLKHPQRAYVVQDSVAAKRRRALQGKVNFPEKDQPHVIRIVRQFRAQSIQRPVNVSV